MPEWILQVLAMVGAAGGTYSAIRADLARINEVSHQARDSAALAHRRIDNLGQRRHDPGTFQ